VNRTSDDASLKFKGHQLRACGPHKGIQLAGALLFTRSSQMADKSRIKRMRGGAGVAVDREPLGLSNAQPHVCCRPIAGHRRGLHISADFCERVYSQVHSGPCAHSSYTYVRQSYTCTRCVCERMLQVQRFSSHRLDRRDIWRGGALSQACPRKASCMQAGVKVAILLFRRKSATGRAVNPFSACGTGILRAEFSDSEGALPCVPLALSPCLQ